MERRKRRRGGRNVEDDRAAEKHGEKGRRMKNVKRKLRGMKAKQGKGEGTVRKRDAGNMERN